jgi:hypothetical protein
MGSIAILDIEKLWHNACLLAVGIRLRTLAVNVCGYADLSRIAP